MMKNPAMVNVLRADILTVLQNASGMEMLKLEISGSAMALANRSANHAMGNACQIYSSVETIVIMDSNHARQDARKERSKIAQEAVQGCNLTNGCAEMFVKISMCLAMDNVRPLMI